MNLDETIKRIKDFGFTVRLSCILLRDFIDDTNKLNLLINYCKEKVLTALSQDDIYRVFVDEDGALVVEYGEE